MTIPQITGVELAGRPHQPLLVVGPSLGTSSTALWSTVAGLLGDIFHVVGWDLPGHGGAPVGTPFTIAELAAGVLDYTRNVAAGRGDRQTAFAYAGVSLGGAVGLRLLLDAPEQVGRAALLCTGATIGEPPAWRERAATVRASGCAAVVTASARRWFAPGFQDREPIVAAELLRALVEVDPEGYAQACEALADFDVRDRLAAIDAPLLAIAGAHDAVTPPTCLEQITSEVRHGRLAVLDDVAHLAPVEAPRPVADLVRGHLSENLPVSSPTLQDVHSAGMAVRRAVLGDAHVDRATAATTSFTADFQELITRYAWGTIWTRPGLDRRGRSMITLTALIARGHHEELAMHLRAALRNGLTRDEIKEVILQSAIYCGVPDANTAFRIAQQVLADETAP
ncbi:4-carboxymuconolactone decarboxylase [Frankia sp. CNm7]|uniref:4-carboxymuconolactone decarboxylase n=1 Tax=Frankia nepalensis TaxID=1836974 RepID=A0A937RM22_9ACTN|nr:4-carboxymuconolactone decarboxylase [Frankia nepalensis]MBL7495726.1 4-carboxymuconolactone decarboxylase [Frankia nepalensis]MBL7509000.1 4-carboxymuconolactone decarboxylase [Frankia nepalensis]MBL7523680.1 4-carboxymuconolactone decarboxylase [Frankia nepalensis]MBL7629799.1 4-carboxymuconolactone decarboxylase [Frankia nepalensis]